MSLPFIAWSEEGKKLGVRACRCVGLYPCHKCREEEGVNHYQKQHWCERCLWQEIHPEPEESK